MSGNTNTVHCSVNCSTYCVSIKGAARHARAHAHGPCAHAHVRTCARPSPVSERALNGGGEAPPPTAARHRALSLTTHAILIELRQALVSYQDYRMLS